MPIVLLILHLDRVDVSYKHIVNVFSIAELDNRKWLRTYPEKVLALVLHIKCFQRRLVEFDYHIRINWESLILFIIAIYIGLVETPDQLALNFTYDYRTPNKVDREIGIGGAEVIFQHN